MSDLSICPYCKNSIDGKPVFLGRGLQFDSIFCNNDHLIKYVKKFEKIVERCIQNAKANNLMNKEGKVMSE